MKLVILDRDGVINQDAGPEATDCITAVADWQPLAGSINAIAALHQAGFSVVIATNQPGLASGALDLDDLEAIHARLTQAVEEAGGEIAAIFYCPHSDQDACNCRKPKTGLIDAIEAEFDLAASEIPFVGDGIDDLLAANAKDCDPILVRTGQGRASETAMTGISELEGVPVFDDLSAAAAFIIQRYN